MTDAKRESLAPRLTSPQSPGPQRRPQGVINRAKQTQFPNDQNRSKTLLHNALKEFCPHSSAPKQTQSNPIAAGVLSVVEWISEAILSAVERIYPVRPWRPTRTLSFLRRACPRPDRRQESREAADASGPPSGQRQPNTGQPSNAPASSQRVGRFLLYSPGDDGYTWGFRVCQCVLWLGSHEHAK